MGLFPCHECKSYIYPLFLLPDGKWYCEDCKKEITKPQMFVTKEGVLLPPHPSKLEVRIFNAKHKEDDKNDK